MKETILSISLIAIATGIFKLLTPENTFKKQIAFLISAFFLLSCISLVKQGGIDFSEINEALRKENGFTDFSEEAYRMTEKEITSEIDKSLGLLLEENKIFCEEISVKIDISSYHSISIKQVRLAFPADDPQSAAITAKAEALIKKEVGDETEVIIEIRSH